ncbi:MAG: glycosyltransferase family A protein [Geobacteraceae bacterium]|nr:glycosyltransferase family A protein [Geobacteraceae bacterium]
MSRPTVSIILPIRGNGTYLETSLRSLIEQERPADQLVIIDDGMEQSAKDCVERLRCLLPPLVEVAGSRQGPAAARNRGLALTNGDIIAFIDDDDIWPQDKLACQLAYLAAHDSCMAVGGRIFWFSRWDRSARSPEVIPGLDNVVHVNLGAYLFRRELFDQIGAFEESQLFAEDVDLILRLADNDIPFALLDKVTLFYRRHDESMTAARSDREQADFRRALFRSLRRRPAGEGNGLRSLQARLVPVPDYPGVPL